MAGLGAPVGALSLGGDSSRLHLSLHLGSWMLDAAITLEPSKTAAACAASITPYRCEGCAQRAFVKFAMVAPELMQNLCTKFLLGAV